MNNGLVEKNENVLHSHRIAFLVPASFEVQLCSQPASASSVLLVHLGAVGALASGAALCGGGAACACSALLHALHPLQLWTVCGLHADRAAAIAAPLHYAAIVSAKKVGLLVVKELSSSIRYTDIVDVNL